MTAGALYLTSAALAQTASTSASSKKDDDVQKMIPFEVSAVKSPGPYIQDTAVSVTKFAVPLIDVPQNIVVFNREFLDDLNVGEMRYALAYNAALQGGVYSIGASYRGFSNQEKLRDGFKMSTFFDYPSIHFESIELLKGPSAVIYGRTEPGGITNYVTKRPVPGKNFAVFNFGIGDNNGNLRQNFSFDINTSLSTGGATPLDLRLTGATQQFEDFISGSTENGKQPQNSIRLAASYWLTDRTRLFVSYLFYERHYFTQFGRYAAFGVTVPQADGDARAAAPLRLPPPPRHPHRPPVRPPPPLHAPLMLLTRTGEGGGGRAARRELQPFRPPLLLSEGAPRTGSVGSAVSGMAGP